MPFSLKINFTGIVALVPNRAFDAKPSRLCFLLIDGQTADVAGNQVEAVDGLTSLKRHRGFVSFDAKHLAGVAFPVENANLLWYLNRQRLGFFLTHEDPGHQAGINVTAPLAGQTLRDVCDLGVLAPGFNEVDPKALDRDKPRSDLLAQIIFDDGDLSVGQLAKEQWEFPDSTHLGGSPPERNLAHQISVTIPGLTAASLLVRPFGGAQEAIELQPAGESEVAIDISNLCDQNPLNWPKSDRQINHGSQDDTDFKWHYQLLPEFGKGSREALRDRLSTPPPPPPNDSRPLPHPIPIKDAGALGGENCFGNTMAPSSSIANLDP